MIQNTVLAKAIATLQAAHPAALLVVTNLDHAEFRFGDTGRVLALQGRTKSGWTGKTRVLKETVEYAASWVNADGFADYADPTSLKAALALVASW